MNHTMAYGPLPEEQPVWLPDRWWFVLCRRRLGRSLFDVALELEDAGYGEISPATVWGIEGRALRCLRADRLQRPKRAR